MPYYRRRNYRRKSYRRYPKKGNGQTDYIKMAKSAYNTGMYLKSLLNVEKKFINFASTINPDSVTGTFNSLSLLAQGTGPSQRVGTSIKPHKLHVNIKMAINSSATHTSIRAILFIDKESNGSTPVIADILGGSATIMSNYNHQEASRFITLKDKTFNLSSQGRNEAYFKIYKQFTNIHIHYDGSTATVTDIQDNAFWLFFVSDEATNTPTVNFEAQFIYIDN